MNYVDFLFHDKIISDIIMIGLSDDSVIALVRSLLSRLIALYPRRAVISLSRYYAIIYAHASIDSSLSAILHVFSSNTFTASSTSTTTVTPAADGSGISTEDVTTANIRSLYHHDRR
jgi:hypothetical protein